MRLSPFAFGTLLTGLGVLILSPDAALIRLVDMEPFGLVFWRGIATFFVMLLALSIARRSQTWRQLRLAVSGTGLVIAALFSMSTAGFVLGAERGDPAFTVVAVAAAPLFAALFSWLIFRERADRITIGAIALGFIGVSLGAFEVLGTPHTHWEGFAGAALVPIAIGLSFTLTRYLPKDQNIWAIYVIAGLFTMALATGFNADLRVPEGKLMYFLPLVIFVGPVAFLLISIGPRYISAAQTSLMLLLETALSPIWVYIAVQLAPGPLTLIGGGILIMTLIGQTLLHLRSKNL